MQVAVIFLLFSIICLIVVIILLCASFDRERIEKYLRSKNCQLIDSKWDPLGPGYGGRGRERIYKIVYHDIERRTHYSHVETSAWSGVYFTNDRIVEDVPKLSVEDEKTALKKRLAELEENSAP